jgi:hypothetical protein
LTALLKRNGTISGHLITTKLSDAPPYFALSYCWGRQKKDVGILCDGKKLKVTASLARALERLQALSGASQNWDLSAKWFWIDQICIYSYRTTMKHLRNLRFIPQFSEGFDFVSERKNWTDGRFIFCLRLCLVISMYPFALDIQKAQ